MLKTGDARCVFNGQSRLLKFYYQQADGPVLRHIWKCHDIGVNDQNIGVGQDEYGHLCKCPPGTNYILGTPQHLVPPEAAYGFYFTPINDDPAGDMRLHGRAGIGIHGGGSDLPDPFAPSQGWEWTFGCLRLQNEDNAVFVNSVNWVQHNGGTVFLDVVWP